jgi:hypothetical protein
VNAISPFAKESNDLARVAVFRQTILICSFAGGHWGEHDPSRQWLTIDPNPTEHRYESVSWFEGFESPQYFKSSVVSLSSASERVLAHAGRQASETGDRMRFQVSSLHKLKVNSLFYQCKHDHC